MAENEWAKPKPENAWASVPSQVASVPEAPEATALEQATTPDEGGAGSNDPPKFSERESVQAARGQAWSRLQAGANWFLVVAGLTLVNTFLAMFNGRMRFIFGLGICDLFNALVREGMMSIGTVYVTDVIIAAAFAFFGLRSRRGLQLWFVSGILLYALDGLLSLYLHWYRHAGFHLIALYCMWQGFRQIKRLRQAEETLNRLSLGVSPDRLAAAGS
jgi:hypothetical protein